MERSAIQPRRSRKRRPGLRDREAAALRLGYDAFVRNTVVAPSFTANVSASITTP